MKIILAKVLTLLEKVLLIITLSMFAAIIIANAMEIFSRTILDYSFYWVQEFTVVISGYMVFLGAVILFKRKGNIFVSIVYNRFPKKMQLLVSVITDLITLVFLIIAMKISYSYLVATIHGRTMTLGLPFFFVYLPMLLGFFFIFLVIVEWLLRDIEKLSGEAKNISSTQKRCL